MTAFPDSVRRAHDQARADSARVLGEHALVAADTCLCGTTAGPGRLWSQQAFTDHVADHVVAAVVASAAATVLEGAAQDLTTGDDFALRSGTNDLDGYDHGVIGAAKKLREFAAQAAASAGDPSTLRP